MRIEFIKTKLVDIEEYENNKSNICLKRIDSNETINIIVDESIIRIFHRINDVLQGERDGIYLSRGMINININCDNNKWQINQEDGKYYEFNKKDVLNILRED